MYIFISHNITAPLNLDYNDKVKLNGEDVTVKYRIYQNSKYLDKPKDCPIPFMIGFVLTSWTYSKIELKSLKKSLFGVNDDGSGENETIYFHHRKHNLSKSFTLDDLHQLITSLTPSSQLYALIDMVLENATNKILRSTAGRKGVERSVQFVQYISID